MGIDQRVIEAEKATYSITRMCELLEVSRAGNLKRHTDTDRPRPRWTAPPTVP
jgi:hypothetical protein